MAFVGGARAPGTGNGGAAYRPPRAPRPMVPSKIQKTRPLAPPKPVGLNSVAQQPSQATQPAAPSPLDGTYFNTLAQNQFQANQTIAGLNAQSGNDRTALQESLRQMAVREPQIEQQATNVANSKGLLYSGALGNQIGNDQTAYTQNQAQANTRFSQAEAGRQSQIAGIQQGLPFGELTARLASIQRAATAAANSPLAAPPAEVPRAQGHSTAYTGPGLYSGAGPTSPALKAVGHSGAYRGPGRYVTVKAHTRAAPKKGKR